MLSLNHLPHSVTLRHSVPVFLFLFLSLGGCEQQGPAERAGEQIDEAVENVGDNLEEAGDKIEEKTD